MSDNVEPLPSAPMADASLEPARRYHKRLNNGETFDEITLRVVPRFKESEVSGDQWRHLVQVELRFKGVTMVALTYRRMQDALMMLPSAWILAQEPVSDQFLAIERERCDQPGCPRVAEFRCELVRETSSDGYYIADEGRSPAFRKFCESHHHRGNQSREDCDDNYRPIP